MLRIPIVLACLAAVAFFATELRADQRCDDARDRVFQTRAQDAAAVGVVRRDCRGTLPLLAVSGSLRAAGRPDDALELAREAADREPQDAGAWRAVAALTRGAPRRQALERLERLDPRSFRRSAGRSTR